MRILFLTQIVPYPPNAGPRIKTWHALRFLASSGHEIILASFVRPEEEEYLPKLQEVCARIHPVPIRRSRLVDGMSWLRSNLSGRPFLVERDDLAEMHHLVARLLQDQVYDAIHADQITMAQFAAFKKSNNGSRLLRIFDAHNATWTIVERMRQTLPRHFAALRPLLSLEARRVKYYEGMIVKTFDHTLAVTHNDHHDLLEAARFYEEHAQGKAGNHSRSGGTSAPRITVVPIAVDTAIQQPVIRQPGSTNILTLGSLNYPPNADGIRWFAQHIFPKVRQQVRTATLTIIGKNPPEELRELNAHHPDSIFVTGFVPDLRPYLERSALSVIPVRAGSGMRVRILDMFSLGMPVITTTIGLEGIEAAPGRDVLVADTPDEFTAAVIRLFEDPVLQEQLAKNGRRLAEQCYDWRAALRKLNDVYKETV